MVDASVATMVVTLQFVVIRGYGALFISLGGLPLVLCSRRHMYGRGEAGRTLVTPHCLGRVGLMAPFYLTARLLQRVRHMKLVRP